MSEDDTDVEDTEASEEDEDEQESDLESANGEAVAMPEEPPREILVLNYQQPVESKLELEGDLLKQKNEDCPRYPGLPGRFRDPKDRVTASVTVYNGDSGRAVRIFHYEHDIPAMMYHSPPVLHPHKALLIWPLGGGEVLIRRL